MDKELTEILSLVRLREIGVEVAKNTVLNGCIIHSSFKRIFKDELINIFESVQCQLLDVEDGKNMILVLIGNYEK